MCGKSRGVGKCPTLGSCKFANAPPPGLAGHANAPQLPRKGGGWAQLELTDALHAGWNSVLCTLHYGISFLTT